MAYIGQSIVNDVEQGATQKTVASTYAAAIFAAASGFDSVNWTTANLAIIERWSWSALYRIKREAWKMVRIHDFNREDV